VEVLRDIKLQTPMRVYTREGDLIGQFGEQKRNPLPFDQIPPEFVQALLAAEDDGFFKHRGIDIMGLLRAVSELVLTGEKQSGGSTLTMQVARNYLLTLDRTFTRKFKEILLSLEIEQALSKQEIFELYFNRVFLGHRAYGFEAAAQVYYGKNIAELDLAQLAMLAGLPKAPSRFNPISNPDRAQLRRNWILGRMRHLDYIDDSLYQESLLEPVTARHHGAKLAFNAPYAAEMARREMIQRYGLAAYSDGYHVFTSIRSELQEAANRAVLNGLMTYDSRHGYRGPEASMPPPGEPGEGGELLMEDSWMTALAETRTIADRLAAIVTRIDEDTVEILLASGERDMLPWENGPSEARPYINENSRGPAWKSPADLFQVGDLIRVTRDGQGQLWLSQIPAAQAALVALDPTNGGLLSVVGGLGFAKSKFNRVTQATRQPGSNFKPFIYSAALEERGFTAASIINDAPVVFEDAALEDTWRPENDGGTWLGPIRLRYALIRSRNLVSIRLLQELGIRNAVNYVERFGFDKNTLPADLSLALGSHAITPLQLVTAYASLANGGYRVEPWLIERVEDFNREVVFQARPATVCRRCEKEAEQALAQAEQYLEKENPDELSMEAILEEEAAEPDLPVAERIMDERVVFIIDSILQDVIRRGTGRKALVLERNDIAGKTGTTNGPTDAWFSGYNQDIVTTAWLGFDQNLKLGRREFGGTAALPIWIDFMRTALTGSKDRPRPLPEGIVNARIDKETGELAQPGQANTRFEYFRVEHVPSARAHTEAGKVTPQDENEGLQEQLF
jgi:penicillin-binding protein 1A